MPDVREGLSAGAELAAAPARAQLAVEAPAEGGDGAAEAGVRVPGAELRPPPPVAGAR